MTVAV